jgi:AraC-like DNA-binding protein
LSIPKKNIKGVKMRHYSDEIYFEPRFWILKELPSAINVWVLKTNHMQGNGAFHSYEVSPRRTTLRIISEGQGSVWINGAKKKVKTGDIFFATPGASIELQEDAENPWQWYEIQLADKNALETARLLGCSGKKPVFSPTNYQDVIHCFRVIHNYFLEEQRSPWGLLSLLYKLIDVCNRSHVKSANKNSREMLVIRAQDLIESMPTMKLNVSELAKELNVDRTTLRRAFKAQTDTSPIEFLKALRIKKARELLTHTNLTGKRIARITGFSDPKYFIHAFRKATGLPPGKWRDNLRLR